MLEEYSVHRIEYIEIFMTHTRFVKYLNILNGEFERINVKVQSTFTKAMSVLNS